MDIGIINITSMPCWGGAEIYLNRLNDFLNENGYNSFIYTGMPSVKGYDNGSVKQKRLVLPAIQNGIEELGVKHGSGIIFQDWTKLTEHTDNWLDLLEKQLKDEPKKDIGIVYLQTLYYPNNDANLVLNRLKPYFRNLITTSFDIELSYIKQLISSNQENPSDTLLETFHKVKMDLENSVGSPNDFHLMSKQNIPEVDYHLHLCHFHKEIMDYLKPTKGQDFVLHPMLSEKWSQNIDYGNHYQPVVENPRDYVIGVINPLLKKGRDIIAEVIARTPYQFLILQGGWGIGDDFLNYLQEEYGTKFPDRVKVADYSQDIVGYFDSVDAFLFPSWIEGYGQVAHESLMRRTPVITSDYPAIHQATIGKAKYIPLTQYNNVDLWISSIKDVFDNQKYWHFECNDAALMLLNRTLFNGQDFIKYLNMISKKEETTHKHIAQMIASNNILEG